MALFQSTKSVLFNGTTQYGTAGDVLDFEYTDPFSISCWFKTTASDALILSKEDTTDFRGYEIGLQSVLGNALDFILRNDNSPSNQITVYGDTTGLNDGKWHHAVVTWKGDPTPDANTDVAMYVDGVPQTLTIIDNSLTGTTLNAASFNVGARNDGTDGWWDGSVDEVAVYDKELSAAEVEWIYNAGWGNDLKHANAPSNLVSWWQMGENESGGVLPDQQSSNDLTLVNSPTIQEEAPIGSAFLSYHEDPGNILTYTWQATSEFDPTLWYRMRGIDITCPTIQQPAYVFWTVMNTPDWDASELSAGDLICGTDPSTDVDDIQIAGEWVEGEPC